MTVLCYQQKEASQFEKWFLWWDLKLCGNEAVYLDSDFQKDTAQHNKFSQHSEDAVVLFCFQWED